MQNQRGKYRCRNQGHVPPQVFINCYSKLLTTLCVVSKNLPLVVQNKERMCKMPSFNRGPLSSSIYLSRHWCHSYDKMDQAFPFRFLCGKTWKWGYWLGSYSILDTPKKHGLQNEVYLKVKLFHCTNRYVYSGTSVFKHKTAARTHSTSYRIAIYVSIKSTIKQCFAWTLLF